jgi:small GTP-binding protein
MNISLKALNIVLVGDPKIGKSTLISKCHEFHPTLGNGGFFTKEFKIPCNYEPTSLQSHHTNIYPTKGHTGVSYSVFQANLIDTGGGRRYDHIRPLAYMNADVFLLCFDISDRTSFLNISSRWLPEIRKYEPNTPVLLVGTKSDLKLR